MSCCLALAEPAARALEEAGRLRPAARRGSRRARPDAARRCAAGRRAPRPARSRRPVRPRRTPCRCAGGWTSSASPPSERDLVAASSRPASRQLAAALAEPSGRRRSRRACARRPVEAVALAGALGADAPAAHGIDELRDVSLEITGDDLLAAGVPRGPGARRARCAARWTASSTASSAGRDAELAAALELRQ